MTQRSTLTVGPTDLRNGDRITYRGVRYEVVGEPVIGKYSVYRVPVRRLQVETVAYDYSAEILIQRGESA